MKTSIQSLATSLSLLVLGLGFSVIGFAPFLSGNHRYSGEGALSFVGSGFSILIGMAFFSAAICFIWERFKSGFLGIESHDRPGS
ncbi:MAG: hypothetical protein JO151_18270 [Verrucomicrobia bacterium]|nr:hypothetical protein [Verrucomicrobiota bacterium]